MSTPGGDNGGRLEQTLPVPGGLSVNKTLMIVTKMQDRQRRTLNIGILRAQAYPIRLPLEWDRACHIAQALCAHEPGSWGQDSETWATDLHSERYEKSKQRKTARTVCTIQ